MNWVSTDRSVSLPTRISLALLIACSHLLSTPFEAEAQQPTQRVLDFQESASGFQLLGTVHEAELGEGQAMQLSATLVEGADYMIIGYCNAPCSNLDLTLFDPDSVRTEVDHLPDAEPVLMFTAEETGSFTVQVDAVACSSASCEVSVGIYGSTDEPGVIPGEDMASRLTLVGAEFHTMGFSPTDQSRRGSLVSEASAVVPVDLEQGVNYRIVGVCDRDCPDLDLALIHPNGTEVDGDYMDDNLPILAHVADTTATYSVNVTMVACFVDPCAFRLETFSQVNAALPGMKTFSGELLRHETHQGELSSSDEELGEAYVDVYMVEAEAGQRIVVDLRSPEFDTLLRLTPPEGKPIENDDFQGEAEHSHLEFLVTTSGLHAIHVTSYEAYTQGEYVLQVAVVQ